MVIRFVKFKSSMSDEEVLKKYEERAPRYRALAGLLQKYYVKDKQTDEHGAVYVWDSTESMREFEQSELSRTIPQAYKVVGQPRVEVLDLVYTLRPEK